MAQDVFIKCHFDSGGVFKVITMDRYNRRCHVTRFDLVDLVIQVFIAFHEAEILYLLSVFYRETSKLSVKNDGRV